MLYFQFEKNHVFKATVLTCTMTLKTFSPQKLIKMLHGEESGDEDEQWEYDEKEAELEMLRRELERERKKEKRRKEQVITVSDSSVSINGLCQFHW